MLRDMSRDMLGVGLRKDSLTTPTQLTQLDFLFWYIISFFRQLGGGGGVSLNPLKKFTDPVQFLKSLTPLACSGTGEMVIQLSVADTIALVGNLA